MINYIKMNSRELEDEIILNSPASKINFYHCIHLLVMCTHAHMRAQHHQNLIITQWPGPVMSRSRARTVA